MKLYNFRDLGGMLTKCNQEVRPGLLYRTGNVAHWSDRAAQYVAEECGVKLYIDFRRPDEVETFGRPEALLRKKIEWLPVSINTSDPEFESKKLPKKQDWLDLYKRLFEKNIEAWRRFTHTVASANVPILYGCLFGKDRTGIGTSLLLNILEVHDTHIVSDYAQTTHEIRPLSEMIEPLLSRQQPATQHSPAATEEEIFEHFSRSHETVMSKFLEYLRTHPSEHPVGEDLQAMTDLFRTPLKSRLLKPPSNKS